MTSTRARQDVVARIVEGLSQGAREPSFAVSDSSCDDARRRAGDIRARCDRQRAALMGQFQTELVALLKPHQIISGLDDLFPLLAWDREQSGGSLDSAVALITGPSRTADIELTLVVGVHGPQELHVILLDEQARAMEGS